jgi:hypothetical protein
VLALPAVFAGDVESEVRGTNCVALSFVGLERTLLDAQLDLGAGGEEGGEGERLEILAREVTVAIGLRELVERLLPRMAGHGGPA